MSAAPGSGRIVLAMTQYRVDSDAVATATGAVKSSIGRIQAEVASLHGQLTNLQDSWSGGAATAFQGVVIDWKATQQRVEESLAGINLALETAGRQYADIEAANQRMFTR
jgi:early secretory antigenic target protein ESAT-6